MILGLTSCRPRVLQLVVHLTAEQTAAQELQLMEHIGSAGWKVTCRNLVCTGCCSRALRPIVRLGSTSYIATCMILGLTSCRPRALQSVIHQCFTCRLVLSSSQKNQSCTSLGCTDCWSRVEQIMELIGAQAGVQPASLAHYNLWYTLAS